VYVVQEDYPLSDENAAVYVGKDFVTVVGATWTPESARLLASEISRVTRKPIREVIDTNCNLDRAGGNPYFKSIGARIVSTNLTRDLLQRDWDEMVGNAPEEKILYGGCVLKEQLGNLALADLTEYPKTLTKLQNLRLGYTTIIAGHWSPIHGPELVDQYLKLLALDASSN
jgi:metallo-beta-lactamase class B